MRLLPCDGSAGATSQLSHHRRASMAVDGDENTYWESGSDAGPNTWYYDFNIPTKITKIAVDFKWHIYLKKLTIAGKSTNDIKIRVISELTSDFPERWWVTVPQPPSVSENVFYRKIQITIEPRSFAAIKEVSIYRGIKRISPLWG